MNDQVTRLLHQMQQGDSAALDRLVPIVGSSGGSPQQ
jgi:hypothetical protein